MSLYEDLVASWVPAKHAWLKQRPLGEDLITGLGNHKMFSYCACTLSSFDVVNVSAGFTIVYLKLAHMHTANSYGSE